MKDYFKSQEIYWRGRDEKLADMCAFLSTLDKEDYGLLFDTSIFNDIAEAYTQVALIDCIEDGIITQEQGIQVLLNLGRRFDILSAEEALRKDKELLQMD